MDIAKLWEYIGIMALLTVAGLAITAITAPHTVQQYYVGRPQSQTTSGFCVMSSINWEQDDAVFCSDDIGKVTTTAKTLNDSLSGRGR